MRQPAAWFGSPQEAADAMARMSVDALKGAVPQPEIVCNRPDAGTRVVVEALENAAPDGNTVLMRLTKKQEIE